MLGEYVEGAGRHRLDVLGTAGATGRGTMPPGAGARQAAEEAKTGPRTGQGGMALGDVRFQGWQWSEGQPVVCMRSRVKDHTTRGEREQGQR